MGGVHSRFDSLIIGKSQPSIQDFQSAFGLGKDYFRKGLVKMGLI